MNKAFGKQTAATLTWVALSLLLIIFSGASARAQGGDAPQPNEEERRANVRNRGRRDPLRALNLTVDQLQQIRAIREESKDEWRAIRERLAQAHSALDDAIYADNINEALIAERAREVGVAQAAVARMRSLTELKIRRVLTPEQLNTLRIMRREARAAERDGERGNRLGQRPSRRDRLGQREDGSLQRGRQP
ncbi:MAG TPA: Spy/CpxP family protein refolding chaperone [Pyrinomonadaceae bacterium]|jgi:Spy/CpxP family protein refolding chaperone